MCLWGYCSWGLHLATFFSSSTIKWAEAANSRLQSRHKLHEPLAINYSNRNRSIGTVLILQAIEFILSNDLSHCIIHLAQMLDTVNQKWIQAGNYRIIGLKLCKNNPLENNTSVITRPRKADPLWKGLSSLIHLHKYRTRMCADIIIPYRAACWIKYVG